MADERQYQGGRRAPLAKAPEEIPPLRPAPPLSDAERERIQETVAFAKEHLPELREIVKDFVDAGLIHGWRNVFIKREKK